MSVHPSLIIHTAHESGTPIVTGCPFPVALVPDKKYEAELVFADGSTLPAQTCELIPRTPGGLKWLELSLISPRKGPAKVKLVPAKIGGGELATITPHGVLLDNSLLRVELNTDPANPPVAIAWQGGSGSLVPELTVNGSAVRESQNGQRTVRITRNGPIRCRVELSGRLFADDGKPSLSYRLVVELWKNKSALRVDWMLSHEIPGLPELNVTRAVLIGEWNLGKVTERAFHQQHYTNEYLQRTVRNPGPVTIIADDAGWEAHVADTKMLLDDTVYSFYCKPSVAVVSPWLQLHGELGAVCATVIDFQETRPNALESSEQFLNYLMVPEGSSLRWPQGRRKEQNLLLSFSAPDQQVEADELARLAGDAFAVGRAMPSPETLASDRCFDLHRALPFIPGQNIRMNNLLDSYCQLNTPPEKWDLGDTPNWHYSLGYAGSLNQYIPLPGTRPPPKRYAFLPASSALFMFIEPAWTNNEYDMIHVLASEIMRTGKTDYFNLLRWTARHNVEIDFVVYSDDPRHHRASPFHSHFHNTKGAITSHFWTQGLLEYYCLTGDDDAREVAVALGDKIIEIDHSGVSAKWKFDREIGWALLALVSLLDCGFEQFHEEADQIVDFLRNYDRQGFCGAVNLSAGRAGQSLERQMIDCGFGYASMVEALDTYQRLTGKKANDAWLNELLANLKTEFWNKVGDGEIPVAHFMTGIMMAIGYERTGDPDFLLAGELILENYLDPTFRDPHPLGSEPGQSKYCAMLYRGFCRLWGALDKVGRLRRFEYPAILEHSKRAARP